MTKQVAPGITVDSDVRFGKPVLAGRTILRQADISLDEFLKLL